MAKRIQIAIEVNENGTVVAKRVGDSFTQAANQIEKNTRESFARMNAGVGQQLDELTTKVVRWGTLTAAVFGGLALRAVGRMGTEFATRMSAVGAFANATGVEFEALRQQALDLGEATVFTATNAAEAMEQLGLAGFKTTEILQVMPDVLSLAAAGSLQMGAAAEIASNVMRQMGLDASGFARAVDTIAFAASESTTTVQELGVAFSYAGNVARTVGMKVEDVASAFGVLANQGLAGERAGTGLVRILSVMLGQTEEGEKGLGKFNLKLFDQTGAFVGLSEAMRQMQGAGMRTQDIMEAFGQRGGPTMLALMNAGSEALDKFTESTKNAGGFAEEMATKLRDNVGGDFEQLTGVLQSISLVIFQRATPALRSLVQSATELGRTWAEMLRGSDVIGGLERVAKLAAGTLAVLFANALRLAAIRTGALAIQVLALAAGVNAVDIAILKNVGVMEAWALSTARARLAMVGLGLAIGGIAYYATRAILEVTGLDKVIKDFMDRSVNAGRDASGTFQQFTQDLDYVDRVAKKLTSEGIGGLIRKTEELKKGSAVALLSPESVDRAKELITNFEVYANTKGKIKLVADNSDLIQATAESRAAVQEFVQLIQSYPKEIQAVWDEAGKSTQNLAERIAKTKELLAAIKPPTTVVPGAPRPDDEAEKRWKQSLSEFEKALTSAGLTSKKMLGEAGAQFELLGAIAKKEGVPLTAIPEAFREQLVKLGEAAVEMKLPVTESLQEVIDQAKKLDDELKNKKLGEQALKALTGNMAEVGLTSRAAIDEFLKNWQRIETEGAAAGISGSEQIAAFRDDILALGEAAVKSGEDVPAALQKLVDSAKKLKDAEVDAEKWKALNDQLQDVGIYSQEAADALTDKLGEAVRIAAGHGITATEVYRAHREELRELVAAYMAAGEEIPAALQSAFEQSQVGLFMETLRNNAVSFVLTIKEAWGQFVQTSIGSMAQLVGQFVVFGGNLANLFKNLVKNAASQAIAMLVQWGAQRLIMSLLAKKTAASEASVNLARGLAETYVNSFASAAAIPFVGWAMAPGVASANLGIAAAGAVGAAATGAGIGAGIGAAGVLMAEGGIADRGPVRGTFGERGAEMVTPLTGAPARRAAKALGIGQGGGSMEVHAHFHGDNWRDGGVADDLLEALHDGIQRLIRLGRIQPFAMATR